MVEKNAACLRSQINAVALTSWFAPQRTSAVVENGRTTLGLLELV